MAKSPKTCGLCCWLRTCLRLIAILAAASGCSNADPNQAKAALRKAYELINTNMTFKQAVNCIETNQIKGVRGYIQTFLDTNGAFIVVWKNQFEQQIKFYVENEKVVDKGYELLD